MDRYEGLCQYALWLTRPRVVREFAWGDFPGVVERKWRALVRSVDRVWGHPVLRRFFRKGRLVVNPDYEKATGLKHPFWELTDLDRHGRCGPWLERWERRDRFHQLTCPLNPPFEKWPQRQGVTATRPSDTHALIRVWAFAYVLGQAPDREWLLFVQSPRRPREDVPVTVPGWGTARVKAPRAGAFYHLREGEGGVRAVGER
jgi:hypothetical protein